MAWYDTGTVSVTNGSTAVVGSGTDFISAKVQVGEAFYGPDGKIYEIAAIVSSTSLTLADNYLGTTQSGQTYKIVPTQSLVADLATNVSTLITDFANVRDIAGEGKFDDGTVAAPGITFNLDQDNGLYRIGANNWAMAVGGSKIVDLTSTGIDVTGTVTADGLTVDTNTLVVDAANNRVGIGVSSPSEKLQINDGRLRFLESGQRQYNIGIASGTPDFQIYDATFSYAPFTLDGSGNVGIGGNGVGNQLGLYINRGATTNFFEASDNTKTFIGGTDSGNAYVKTGSLSAHPVGIVQGNVPAIYIDTSKNVGIGTEISGVRLHVEGATDSNVMIVNNIGTAPNYIFDVRDDGVSKFRVDPFGNVHIGAGTASTANLSIITSGQAGGIQLNRNTSGQPTSGQSLGSYAFKGVDSANSNATAEAMIEAVAAETHSGSTAATNMIFYTKASGIGPGSSPTPRMTLDSSGSLLISCTSFGAVGLSISEPDLSGIYSNCTATTSVPHARFVNGNGQVGDITTSGTATAYNTSSDYRLKENVVAISGATERLKQLKPSRFNFIADPNTTVDGFLAHEVQDIVPEAITGTKDAVDAEGNPEYQGIDQSKLVPLLVATIQELEARIAALEGAN